MYTCESEEVIMFLIAQKCSLFTEPKEDEKKQEELYEKLIPFQVVINTVLKTGNLSFLDEVVS